MSELKTNKISTNDGNNVAIDNSLGLKSYTTTQRDALTSAAGDTIYNSSTTRAGGNGGSGIVIISYDESLGTLANDGSGGGLTVSTSTSGGKRIYQFTAGTGTITF